VLAEASDRIMPAREDAHPPDQSVKFGGEEAAALVGETAGAEAIANSTVSKSGTVSQRLDPPTRDRVDTAPCSSLNGGNQFVRGEHEARGGERLEPRLGMQKRPHRKPVLFQPLALELDEQRDNLGLLSGHLGENAKRQLGSAAPLT
jgi:hypothetical protein